MRVCPECRKQYADDVEACPDDGMALLAAPDRLPANPELRDVVPVSPTDHTAMIDLEAIEAERERRAALNPPAASSTAEETEDADGAGGDDDEAEQERHDPDATGTFFADDLKRQERTQLTSAGSLVADADDAQDDADPGDAAYRREATQVTRRPRGDEVTAGRPRADGAPAPAGGARPGKPPVVLVAAIAGAAVVALGLSLAVWWYVSSRGAVLTVTSVPPGATILLDGEEVGVAPMQDRVAIGSHVIELTLAGYKPFKEVVDVPAEGLPFLQPLEADPGSTAATTTTTDAGPRAGATPPPPGAPDGGADVPSAADGGPTTDNAVPSADALVTSFDELVAKGDYDAALDRIKQLVMHHPTDKRADALFGRLADARIQKASGSKRPAQHTGKRTLTPEQKKREAREAYAAGEALYREGSYDEARAKLLSAIQLDPRFPQPHRAVARLYERANDIAKTRYHLDRYLRLGGRDPDYRVRRWLEDHKE